MPDALVAAPGAGRLIALGRDGTVSVTGTAGGSWGPLTTERALATAPAARDCDLTGLTAVAYTPAGTPLVGGTCGRGGRVGLFAKTAGTWQQASPALPAWLSGQPVRVLRLSRSGNATTTPSTAATARTTRTTSRTASDLTARGGCTARPEPGLCTRSDGQ